MSIYYNRQQKYNYSLQKFVDKKNKICYNERGDSAFVESLKGRMRRGL